MTTPQSTADGMAIEGFAPGPWAIDREYQQVHIVVDGAAVARVMHGRPDGEANARLIALAPTLYAENATLRADIEKRDEALWKCIAALERTHHVDEAGRIEAADAARAAIASRKGAA